MYVYMHTYKIWVIVYLVLTWLWYFTEKMFTYSPQDNNSWAEVQTFSDAPEGNTMH